MFRLSGLRRAMPLQQSSLSFGLSPVLRVPMRPSWSWSPSSSSSASSATPMMLPAWRQLQLRCGGTTSRGLATGAPGARPRKEPVSAPPVVEEETKEPAEEGDAVDALEAEMESALRAPAYTLSQQSTGTLSTIREGFAIVEGLPTATLHSLVTVQCRDPARTKVQGLVMSVEARRVSVALLAPTDTVRPGDVISHSASDVPTFPYGMGVIGRVLDPLGEPLDGKGPLVNVTREPSMERAVPGITARAPIQSMIESGIKHFDIFHPLAKGMRMGLYGPPKSGKSSLAASIVANQASANARASADLKTYCVYVLTGQSKTHHEKVLHRLVSSGAMAYSTVIVARHDDPLPVQYLAPYAGCTAAEWFRDTGKHALVVYDDMAVHGAVYNSLYRAAGARLLSTTFVQAKILERAAHMSPARGGGSMTALCLYERKTDTPDPLSNTEGFVDQIVDTDGALTTAGFWPPISCSKLIGRPPTRYQPLLTRPVTRQMTELICHSLATSRTYEWASRLKVEMEEDDLELVAFKDKLQVLLSQERAMPIALQFVSLYAAGRSLLADVEVSQVPEWERQLQLFMYNYNRPILRALERLKLTDSVPQTLLELLNGALSRYAVAFPQLLRAHEQAKAAAKAERAQLQQQQQKDKAGSGAAQQPIAGQIAAGDGADATAKR